MNNQPNALHDSLNALRGSRLLLVGALTGLLITGALVGYAVSYFQGINALGLTPAQIAQLQRNVKTSLDELQRLKETNNVLASERDTAINLVSERRKISQRQLDEAAAKDNLIKQLMAVASQKGGIPLSINQFDIKPLPEDAFAYRLDLFQASDLPYLAEGTVELIIIAGDKTYRVPMANSAFSFKSRATMEGRFSLPKGLKPDFIDVHVAGNRHNFERRYQWRLGETLSNFPATLAQYEQRYGNDEPATLEDSATSATTAPAKTTDTAPAKATPGAASTAKPADSATP